MFCRKTVCFILLILSFSALLSNGVAAQSAAQCQPFLTLLPTNVFYGFQTGFVEPLQADFAGSANAKACVYLGQATARIQSIQTLHFQGPDQYDAQLAADYQTKMNLVNQNLDSIPDNATKAAMAQTIMQTTSIHVTVLQDLLASAPPQAQQGLLIAIAASQNGETEAAQTYADDNPSTAIIIPKITCTPNPESAASCSTTSVSVSASETNSCENTPAFCTGTITLPSSRTITLTGGITAITGQTWSYGCPAIQSGQQCGSPYPNFPVAIYNANSGALVETITSDSSGHFTAPLPPGQYVVYTRVASGLENNGQTCTYPTTFTSSWVGCASTPQYITLTTGQVATVTVNIPNGIE